MHRHLGRRLVVPALLAAVGTLGAVGSAAARQRTAFVDVSVATLWTDSSKPRAIDAPALANPARTGTSG